MISTKNFLEIQKLEKPKLDVSSLQFATLPYTVESKGHTREFVPTKIASAIAGAYVDFLLLQNAALEVTDPAHLTVINDLTLKVLTELPRSADQGGLSADTIHDIVITVLTQFNPDLGECYAFFRAIKLNKEQTITNLRVIRRNNQVVMYDESKIQAAISSAFSHR
ncbi:MAG: hypothetical protein WC786_06665, partial [Patescibacteria group bacterium]